MGEGWERVKSPAGQTEMKKYPPRGALRQDTTEAERRIWQVLGARQISGHKFRRQVPIGRYIADFVCHEARLTVEIDGGQHDHQRAGRITPTQPSPIMGEGLKT